MKGLAKTCSYLIEPRDLNRVLDDMDKFCVYRRKQIDEACLSKQMKQEHNVYWNGYQQAVEDFCHRLRKLKGIG